MSAPFETLVYSVQGPIASITLNRPQDLNTIVPPMPDELEAGARPNPAHVVSLVPPLRAT